MEFDAADLNSIIMNVFNEHSLHTRSNMEFTIELTESSGLNEQATTITTDATTTTDNNNSRPYYFIVFNNPRWSQILRKKRQKVS